MLSASKAETTISVTYRPALGLWHKRDTFCRRIHGEEGIALGVFQRGTLVRNASLFLHPGAGASRNAINQTRPCDALRYSCAAACAPK